MEMGAGEARERDPSSMPLDTPEERQAALVAQLKVIDQQIADLKPMSGDKESPELIALRNQRRQIVEYFESLDIDSQVSK